MQFTEVRQIQNELRALTDAASLALKLFPKGDFGLTPDSVKFSPEYKAAKSAFDCAFQKERKFNQLVNKHFKKELRQERLSK